MTIDTNFILEIIGFLILIVLSGLFSSSETAFLNSQKQELKSLSDNGYKKAKYVLKLLQTPKIFIDLYFNWKHCCKYINFCSIGDNCL